MRALPYTRQGSRQARKRCVTMAVTELEPNAKVTTPARLPTGDITAIECDLDDFLHQLRSDVCLLQRKIDADLKDDAEAVIQQMEEDIDAIDRCVQRVLAEMR